MSKLVSIQCQVYTLDEACKRLAALAHHKNPCYSRGGFYRIVRKYKPELIEPVITEGDLEFLAQQLRKPGRPKNIDEHD